MATQPIVVFLLLASSLCTFTDRYFAVSYVHQTLLAHRKLYHINLSHFSKATASSSLESTIKHHVVPFKNMINGDIVCMKSKDDDNDNKDMNINCNIDDAEAWVYFICIDSEDSCLRLQPLQVLSSFGSRPFIPPLNRELDSASASMKAEPLVDLIVDDVADMVTVSRGLDIQSKACPYDVRLIDGDCVSFSQRIVEDRISNPHGKY